MKLLKKLLFISMLLAFALLGAVGDSFVQEYFGTYEYFGRSITGAWELKEYTFIGDAALQHSEYVKDMAAKQEALKSGDFQIVSTTEINKLKTQAALAAKHRSDSVGDIVPVKFLTNKDGYYTNDGQFIPCPVILPEVGYVAFTPDGPLPVVSAPLVKFAMAAISSASSPTPTPIKHKKR